MNVGDYTIYKRYPRQFDIHALKGENLIGVEIGVYEGNHAVSLLKNCNIKMLHLIDPYESCPMFETPGELFSAKEKAMRRLSRYTNKIKWYFKKSKIAFIEFEDESLDFVYIDGLHDYENVKTDIELYWNKVKQGGVMGGDDFFIAVGDVSEKFNHSGVIKAVIEFAVANNLKLNVRDRDWWIFKNA